MRLLCAQKNQDLEPRAGGEDESLRPGDSQEPVPSPQDPE